MKKLAILILGFTLTFSSYAGEKKQSVAEHLQNVSVTIRSEGAWSAGEGSGVIFTRKDSKGNLVNFVWTAGHVVDNLRKERKVLVNGSPKTLVEFKDPVVIKEIRQNGRTVGRLQMDAEVLKYSEIFSDAFSFISSENLICLNNDFYIGETRAAYKFSEIDI